jgi:hypothetical protein
MLHKNETYLEDDPSGSGRPCMNAHHELIFLVINKVSIYPVLKGQRFEIGFKQSLVCLVREFLMLGIQYTMKESSVL